MRFMFSLLIFAASALPAAAYNPGTSAQRAACTPDVFRLCSSEIPNVDGIIACLRREKAHLSGGCRAAVSNDDNKMATRSLKTNAEWCAFEGEAAAVDEVWRAWCKGK